MDGSRSTRAKVPTRMETMIIRWRRLGLYRNDGKRPGRPLYLKGRSRVGRTKESRFASGLGRTGPYGASRASRGHPDSRT